MKPKLCSDCKHFVPNTLEWQTNVYAIKYAICGLTSTVTPVVGELCLNRRSRFFDRCGKSAKQWEPK